MNQSQDEKNNQVEDPSAVEEQSEATDQAATAAGEKRAAEGTSQESSGEAEAGTAESSNEVDELRAQLEEAQRKAEEAEQRWLRAQADFDNYRRRTRQEKEQFSKYAAQGVIEQLLPVIDNFERAIASSQESKDFDSLAKGIDMVFRQMMNVLENEGLQPIEAVGTAFDPEVHQAVMQVESDEHEEGIVVEELQKGYKLKEKVLRPSMVKVSSS